MTSIEDLKKPVTTRMARRMLATDSDVPTSTFNYWVNRTTPKGNRMIVPLVETGGGESNVFSVQQIWALGVAKAVKAAGHSVELAAAVGEFLASLDADYIEKCLPNKRLVVASQVAGEVSVHPGLMDQDQWEHIQTMQAEAIKCGIVLTFAVVDVKPLLDQLVARAAEQNKKPSSKKAPKRKRRPKK